VCVYVYVHQIVSIDAVKSDDIPSMRVFFRALNKRLRDITFLAKVPFVVIVEQDLANGVAIVKDVTSGQQMRGYYYFYEDPDNEKSAGVAKRGKSNAYPTRMTKVLEEKRLVFDPNLFTLTLTCAEERHTATDSDSKLPNADANNAIDYLKYEMLRFGYDEKKHMHHGKWNNQNDDTAVTLQMLVYWMQEIYKPYSVYQKQINRYIDSYRPDSVFSPNER
jgi:hypothetical protein